MGTEYKRFEMNNYTIIRSSEYVDISYKNEIGIEKTYRFSKIETEQYKLIHKLDVDKARTNLQTSFLFYEKEKHEKIIYFIENSFINFA